MSFFTRPFEQLSDDTKTYIDLRLDDVKLKLTKGLSLSMGQFLSMTLIAICVSMVVLALAVAAAVFLGEILGSYALGAIISAGVLMIITLGIYLLRDKLFVNTFVKLFSGILRDENGRLCNLKELDSAQKRVEKDIPLMEKVLGEDLSQAQNMMKPSNLLSGTLLGLVRGTKKLLLK